MTLHEAISKAKPGDTIAVPAGVHTGSFEVTKPLTLKGEGAAKSILDGKNLGACVMLNHPDAELKLIGLTLRNGSSPAGGALSYFQGKRLEVEDCVLESSSCTQYGGGGAFLVGPSAIFTRVKIHKCSGTQGGGLLVDEEANLELRGCLITGNSAEHGGGIRLKEGAKLSLLNCTVSENAGVGKIPLGVEILMGGSSSRTPELRIINSIIQPKRPTTASVMFLGKYEGTVVVAHSLLPEADQGLRTGTGVRYGVPDFFPSGLHRHKLGPSSPAAGTADPKQTPPGLKDFLGKALSRGSDADMGAYAAF